MVAMFVAQQSHTSKDACQAAIEGAFGCTYFVVIVTGKLYLYAKWRDLKILIVINCNFNCLGCLLAYRNAYVENLEGNKKVKVNCCKWKEFKAGNKVQVSERRECEKSTKAGCRKERKCFYLRVCRTRSEKNSENYYLYDCVYNLLQHSCNWMHLKLSV